MPTKGGMGCNGGFLSRYFGGSYHGILGVPITVLGGSYHGNDNWVFYSLTSPDFDSISTG